MVQSALFFILGFLCAGFLAVLLGPAIWRRAVRLTQRRVEASLPMTLAEIQADKDRARADHAMAVRRLEVTNKALQEKAATQTVEIARGHEDLKASKASLTAREEAASQLEARIAALEAELGRREEQIQLGSEKLAKAEQALKQRETALGELEKLYDEASFSSSNRQIELVARESQIDKISGDVSQLRSQRKEADRRYQLALEETRRAQEELKAEKTKSGELDKKLERLLATLADRDDKLERREKDLQRLRERTPGANIMTNDGGEPVSTADDFAGVVTPANDADPAQAKVEADRRRLEQRLTVLARENKRLRSELAGEGQRGTLAGDAELREQISELAAEIVNLTIRLEGPESPAAKVVGGPAKSGVDGSPSLADRIRALRDGAAG
ncbi:hypothetical protein ASD44_10010 [Mesorhizobium sp. Root554]|uniref:hypothetical protein n=1 Tax=unclassified Mesorhizobium TaxID=325217 RepID=UPI0006F40DF2|nr:MULTISPECIES: hypothetical protein [unclassified Mesorhizobium]KQZ14368.1 hypothetical protein ASD27_10020 [Mesorhizobium sp. Root1471]KQZ36879.1 hypothetical protein ASD44_10010 [Mesorhizobium sp. Root554]